jgi:hypothetical protein
LPERTISSSAKRFFEGRQRIEAVQLIEVDVVQLQALQAGVQLVHQVIARLTAAVGSLAHDAGGLGGDHQFVARQAKVLDRLAEQLFGLAERIDVGRVDEIDASVDAALDDVGNRVLAEAAHHLPEAVTAEGHGTQAEFRDIESGIAQQTKFHGDLLCRQGRVG